ncbi:hypothetical protein [Pseudomonas poae]|uniref:hypothetical protein n=1 Tax=Pseudomonas poae TaxID=200451 RepID=UPI0034D629BE
MATLGVVIKLDDEKNLSKVFEGFGFQYFDEEFLEHHPSKFKYVAFVVGNSIRAVAKIDEITISTEDPSFAGFRFSEIVKKSYISTVPVPGIKWLNEYNKQDLEDLFNGRDNVLARPEPLKESIDMKAVISQLADAYGVATRNIQITITG